MATTVPRSPDNSVNGGHAVHTTGLVRDADGNVTHYVINDTGTGTSGRMVPADQFHQSLDTGPAVVTDAPIRTSAAVRDAAPTTEGSPAAPEGTTVPRDAASRGDPASEEGDPASGERSPEGAKPAEEAKPSDTPEAKASREDAQAAGDGDPTVQTGDRPGGLENGEGDTATRGATSERYGDLKTKLPADEQAHHLNQNAAFSRDNAGNTFIPKEDGVATGLEGNAFKDAGTAHYEAHNSLEKFWDQYRVGDKNHADGALLGEKPTNAEYDQALRESLKKGGLGDQDVDDLAKAAEKNRLDYGLTPTDNVPRIPGRIYQTPPPPAPLTTP